MKKTNEKKKRVTIVMPNSCRTCCSKCCKTFVDNLLLILLFLGVLTGVGLGVCLKLFVPAYQSPEQHPREMMYLFFPAEIFIRIMTLLSLPLIVSSLVSGIGYLDTKVSGKVGLRVLCYYLGTTCIAVTEGFIFVYTIRPGTRATSRNATSEAEEFKGVGGDSNRVDTYLDMIRNIFPDNIITATFNLYSTKVTHTDLYVEAMNDTINVEKFENSSVEAMNILGITLSSILFGIALSAVGEKGRLLFSLFDALFETIMKIIHVALWLYPLGIIFMIASTIVELDDPINLMKQLFIFLLTLVAGLLTHALIVLPVIYFVIVRKNPYKHLLRCVKALVTAFATSNSTVTVPVTMECLEKAHQNPRVIRFMIPVGACVNMDGFALYEALACIFIAFMNGMNPSASQVIVLGLTAVAVSIGAPTAGNAIVLYVILFKTLGLPIKDVALLIPFDWILGRVRTSINVWGDCVGVGVVEHLSLAELAKADALDNELNSPSNANSHKMQNHDEMYEAVETDDKDEVTSDYDNLNVISEI